MKTLLAVDMVPKKHCAITRLLEKAGYTVVHTGPPSGPNDPAVRVDDFVGPLEIEQRAARWSAAARPGWSRLTTGLPSVLRVEAEAMRPMVARSYARVEAFITRVRPAVVLTGSNQLLSKAAVACARREGIPTVYLPHAAPTLKLPYRMPVTDWTAELGELPKRWYAELGAAGGRSVMTGAPYWDRPARRPRGPRPRVLYSIHPPYTESPTAVAASPALAMRFWKALLGATRRLSPRPELILKPHPSVALPGVRRFHLRSARRAGVRRVRWMTGTPGAALAESDVVITGYSNLVYEAILADCPVILIPSTSSIVRSLESVRVADRPRDLLGEIRRALAAPPREALRRDTARLHAGGDGRAAERIAAVIFQAAGQGNGIRVGANGG